MCTVGDVKFRKFSVESQGMKAVATAHRLIVLLGLALVLLVALTQPVIGLLLAFLIPEWFFFAAVVSSPLPVRHEPCVTLTLPILSIFPPRPPPIR